MKNIVQKSIFNTKYEEHKGDISELLVDLHLRRKSGLSWYPRALYEQTFTENESSLAVTPRSSVLDVGCGVGASAISFVLSGAEVVGIDFSAAGIKRARNIFNAAGEKKISFKQADFFALHKNRKRYDVISLQTFMEHMEDMGQAGRVLRTAKILLKPGGKIFIYTVNKHFIYRSLAKIFKPDYLRKQLEAMGHHDQLFYDEKDFRTLFAQVGLKTVKVSFVFGPVSFLYDLYLYPKILSWYLSSRESNTIPTWAGVYDHVILPVLRIFSVLDMPFIRAGNSSGIIAIAVKL